MGIAFEFRDIIGLGVFIHCSGVLGFIIGPTVLLIGNIDGFYADE